MPDLAWITPEEDADYSDLDLCEECGGLEGQHDPDGCSLAEEGGEE